MAFGRLGSLGRGFGHLGAGGKLAIAPGAAGLLTGEANGFAADFTYSNDAQRVAVKTASVVVESGLDAFFTNTGLHPKLVYDVTGAAVWSPHNMFLNSAAPATQSVTTVVGQNYTVSVVGTGTLTGSAGAAGVASAGSPLTFTATTTTSTFTLAGGPPTRIQMNRGAVATAYLATTGAVRSGLAVDYDPVTHAALGMLVEATATNLILNNATMSTQNVVVSAVAYVLSFWGTGTITLSGVSTAGPLVGTGAANRVALTFTPTGGTLTLTVTGTVSNAQIETGTVPTSLIPTFGATVARNGDVVSFLLSAIPTLSTEYSAYCRFSAAVLGTSRYVYAIGDGTAAEFIGIISGAAQASLQVVDNSVTQASLSAGTFVAGVFTSNAARIKANDFAYSVDGSAVATDAVGTLPSPTQVKFGSNTTAAQAQFRIQKFVIITARGWTNGELQGKSAT